MSERMKLQRKREKATAFPAVQDDALQRSTTTPEQTIDGVLPIVQEALSSNGQPLDSSTREFMDPRFGHDFSQVRVHTDERAVESAQAVNALAYTVGRDVVFGEGQYVPGTSEGRGLLAHELTHIIQQQQSGPKLQRVAKTDAEIPVATVKMYEYIFEGQKVTLTEEQYQHEIARVSHHLEVEFERVESTAAWMKEEHEKFMSETHAHWYSVGVVSDIIGDTVPPNVGIWSWPNAAIANGREALKAGRVENAARQLHLASQYFNDAQHEWNIYMKETIGGAKLTQGYLENVRDISFSIAIGTAAVVAAPVVAGAIGISGTGLVVTGGGALAGGSLRAGTSAAGQALAGEEVSGLNVWQEFITGAKRGAVDAATSVIGVGAGKALGTAGGLGGRVAKGALAGAASGAGGSAFEATLEGKSAEEIAQATGKGAFTGLIGSGVGGGSGHLLGEASTGARFATGAISGGTANAAGTALAGGSKEDIEAAFLTGSLTGGVSSAGEHSTAALEYQAPPAQQSVPEVESATPSPELKVEKPVASESTVAAHVTEESQMSDIALKKPEVSTVEESDAMWEDLGKEMQNEPEGKGPVVGQKLGKRTPEDELAKQAGVPPEVVAVVLPRQRAAALRSQAQDYEAQAMSSEKHADNIQTAQPDRANRMRQRASRLRDRASDLRKEADQFVSGARSATEDLPGPEDIPEDEATFFEKVASEAKITRVRLSDLERKPENLPRLARPLMRSQTGNRVVYRVEGGGSRELLHIDPTGNVVVVPGETIYLNFGSEERAVEFLRKREAGARIVAFEVDEQWVQAIRSAAIPEYGTKALRGRQPRLVDIRFAEDQLEIPGSLTRELQDFIIPGTGRVVETR